MVYRVKRGGKESQLTVDFTPEHQGHSTHMQLVLPFEDHKVPCFIGAHPNIRDVDAQKKER
jgi:hypothetical protein